MTAARTRIPGALKCFGLLVAVDASTRLLGLRRTLAIAAYLGKSRNSIPASHVIDAIAYNVAVAAAFYPRRALCLEQSLTLYLLLRRRGVDAQLRLGVQPRPFYAHAWVEVDDAPVNEPTDLPLNMSTFPLLGA